MDKRHEQASCQWSKKTYKKILNNTGNQESHIKTKMPLRTLQIGKSLCLTVPRVGEDVGKWETHTHTADGSENWSNYCGK